MINTPAQPETQRTDEPIESIIERPFQLRLRGLIVAAPALAILILAFYLRPMAGGHGTHEQLNIPPCSFLSQKGWPCPGCGVTTSLAATAHGQLALAWRSQPFGVMLFLAAAVLAVVGLIELLANRPVLNRLRFGWWWTWIFIIGMLAGWGWKVVAGYYDGIYPLR